ncbi:MAG: acyl carrier protein [Acidobacteriota bacterium]
MMAIDERLRTLISKELGFPEDEITRDASFRDDLGADSLDLVEVVMAAEEEFDIEIDDDTAEMCTTFGRLVDVVTARVERKKVGAA